MGSKTYTLQEVIKLGVESSLVEKHTALPGEIQSYDSSLQTAQIRISINRKIDGESIEFPILDDVPVCFPRSKGSGINFPLASGDSVLLIFNERNIDRWRSFGSGQEPTDSRKFDVNDAVAIPGFFPLKDVMIPPPISGATELRGEKIFLGDPASIITTKTTLPLGSPGTMLGATAPTVLAGQLDLVTIVELFMKIMAGANYGTIPGPTGGGGGVDPETESALNSLISDISKLKAGA